MEGHGNVKVAANNEAARRKGIASVEPALEDGEEIICSSTNDAIGIVGDLSRVERGLFVGKIDSEDGGRGAGRFLDLVLHNESGGAAWAGAGLQMILQ